MIVIYILIFSHGHAFARSDFDLMNQLQETEKKVQGQTIERSRVRYGAENLKDPFQQPSIDGDREGIPVTDDRVIPPDKLEVPLPPLLVQGIVWGGSFPQAIINNKVVKVGDVVEGVQVVSIDKSGVKVYFEGNQHTLQPPAGGGMPSSSK